VPAVSSSGTSVQLMQGKPRRVRLATLGSVGRQGVARGRAAHAGVAGGGAEGQGSRPARRAIRKKEN
jgi:hypothetical protein